MRREIEGKGKGQGKGQGMGQGMGQGNTSHSPTKQSKTLNRL